MGSSSRSFLVRLFLLLFIFSAPGCLAANALDHPTAAANLFNSMRTPAALIGGAIVPMGLLTAPPIRSDETGKAKAFKKANFLLAVASLLSEILAITYSTVAMNNLAGFVSSPSHPTTSVADLISKHFELSWVGANVHFFLGALGFALLVGSKAHFMYGRDVGRIASCWSVASALQCLSIVNRGISRGHGYVQSEWFANNLPWLIFKYVKLVVQRADGKKILPLTAVALIVYSLGPTVRLASEAYDERD